MLQPAKILLVHLNREKKMFIVFKGYKVNGLNLLCFFS